MTTLTDLTLAELIDRRRSLDREINRRHAVDNAERQLEELNRTVLDAQGLAPGDPWREPSGAHDAYPAGWTVTHDGRAWTSMVAGANMWEPGSAGGGWRADDAPDGTPAEWVRPSSTQDAYGTGDRVVFEGQVYESVWPNPNTWSPTEYPDAWKLVEEA